jgi:uncharacterized protein
MIVPDANLLLYAYDENSRVHENAAAWLSSALSGDEPIGIPWQTIWAFLRISTNIRIFTAPLSMEQAIGLVDEWLAQDPVRLLAPGERHWNLLKEMLDRGQASGAQTTDAQLAATTLEYGGVLYTTDRDYARFPGLRWVNPLERN